MYTKMAFHLSIYKINNKGHFDVRGKPFVFASKYVFTMKEISRKSKIFYEMSKFWANCLFKVVLSATSTRIYTLKRKTMIGSSRIEHVCTYRRVRLRHKRIVTFQRRKIRASTFGIALSAM